jgi:hypothetical protein
MSDRHKTHNGRDTDGHFKVKQADVDDLLEDPKGADYLKDDVRLSGAVADTGPQAGVHGEEIERMIDANREDVERLVRPDAMGTGRGARRPPRKHRGKH